MPSDSDAPGAPAAKVDFTSVMANVKAIAARHGIAASMAGDSPAPYSAPPPKRPYEEESYGHHDSSREDDSYGKRMAYDSGRGMFVSSLIQS